MRVRIIAYKEQFTYGVTINDEFTTNFLVGAGVSDMTVKSIVLAGGLDIDFVGYVKHGMRADVGSGVGMLEFGFKPKSFNEVNQPNQGLLITILLLSVPGHRKKDPFSFVFSQVTPPRYRSVAR